MSEEVLNVEIRESRGSSAARRLRNAGKIPVILYGQGKDNVSLSISLDEMETALRHRSRLVTLKGDVNETAFLASVQWNTFATHPLHADLTRVNLEDVVEATLVIQLRGEAIGVKEGGHVEQLLRELTISCPVGVLPELITVAVKDLGIGDSLKCEDIPLPTGAKLVTGPDTVVVQCVQAMEDADEEDVAAVAGGSEPEVIGRKAGDEDEAAE